VKNETDSTVMEIAPELIQTWPREAAVMPMMAIGSGETCVSPLFIMIP
jgi:hypothetical protein